MVWWCIIHVSRWGLRIPAIRRDIHIGLERGVDVRGSGIGRGWAGDSKGDRVQKSLVTQMDSIEITDRRAVIDHAAFGPQPEEAPPMNESPKDVASKTGVLSVLAQVMTGLGFITMLVGGALVGVALIQELGGDDGEFQVGEVLGAAYLLLMGLFLAGNGQLLTAIRSIAINTAVTAEK
jgi:hypothetical protein